MSLTNLLDYDHIPIERTWEVSWVLHEACGHPPEEEMFCQKCEALTNKVIMILFGTYAHKHDPLQPSD